MPRLTLIYTFIAACLFVSLDQYTKRWGETNLLVHSDESDSHLYQGSRRPIFALGEPNDQEDTFWVQFQWNYVRNHGAAWGVLASLAEQTRQIIFQLGTLMLSGLLMFLALQKRWQMPTLSRIAILIIVAGALSNLYDRMGHGYVIDVLDVRWQWSTFRYSFPAFNIADTMIVSGLLIATAAEFSGTSVRSNV